MARTLRDSQRIRKEDDFLHMLKNAPRLKNDFFFYTF
jgi:hypothetical protein